MNKINFKNFTYEQKLIISVIALIFFVLGSIILNIDRTKIKKINYKDTTGEKLILESEIVTDNSVYLIANDIINKLFSSYDPTDPQKKSSDNFISYKDCYSGLTSEYRKKLSKSAYEKKIINFFDKFKVDDSDGTVSLINSNVLKKLYKYDDDRYICVLKNDVYDNLKKSTTENYAYIGIALNTNDKTWSIFYIE